MLVFLIKKHVHFHLIVMNALHDCFICQFGVDPDCISIRSDGLQLLIIYLLSLVIF